MLRRRMAAASGGRLPSRYQECEWIQSDGYAAIDTGIYYSTPTKIEFSFLIPSLSSNTHIFAVNGANSGTPYFEVLSTGKVQVGANGGQISTSQTISANSKKAIVWDMASTSRGGMTLTVDGTAWISGSFYNGAPSSYSSYTLTMFNYRSSGNYQYTKPNRGYECKITQNGAVVREYVPCYIKATDEAGYFDLASQQFFGNDNSQGSFSHGADVAA